MNICSTKGVCVFSYQLVVSWLLYIVWLIQLCVLKCVIQCYENYSFLLNSSMAFTFLHGIRAAIG